MAAQPNKQAKIISRIFGGIGNQLFCYAAARRLALVNNAELAIDDVSGFLRDRNYRRCYHLDHFSIPCRKATATERLEPFSRVRRYLKRKANLCRPFQIRNYIQQEGIDFDPRLLAVKPRGVLYIEGYWQSEQYFKDVDDSIKADLSIVPPQDMRNQEMALRIRTRQAAVAVHVRFFDAPGVLALNNAPVYYYTRAIAQMEILVPDAHYFLFSDKPDAARSRIPLPDDRVTCVAHNQGDENAYADLWLMTQCQHFIIANSTFSWWGAWLGEGADKIVLAPDLHIEGETAWGFAGLIPAGWLRI